MDYSDVVVVNIENVTFVQFVSDFIFNVIVVYSSGVYI